MDMRQIPMPPPPAGFGGGATHVDEWQGRMPSSFDDSFANPDDRYAAPFDDHVQNKSRSSKDKTKNFGKERIEPSLKGYILVKADPPLGQKANWARVYKRDLPIDDKNLATEIKTHQRKTGKKVSTIFRELSLNQQGIVNRMVAQHILKDKNSHAEWVLADVQRFGVTRLGRLIETKKMQVTFQRQLRGDDRKPGTVNASNARNYHEFGEIIDLAEPLSGKKDKKGKKQQDWYDDNIQPVDVIYEPAAAGWAQPEPVYDAHVNQHHHQQQHQPQQQQPIYDDPMPPPMVPFPSDPMAYPPHHDAQMPLPPLPQQYQPPFPAAHQNPFTPNLDIMPPGQYEQPRWDDQPPIRPRVYTPAAERKRPASARRLRKLETSVDYLTRKVEDWNVSSGDSSEGHRDRESIFSDPHTGGTKTPAAPRHRCLLCTPKTCSRAEITTTASGRRTAPPSDGRRSTAMRLGSVGTVMSASNRRATTHTATAATLGTRASRHSARHATSKNASAIARHSTRPSGRPSATANPSTPRPATESESASASTSETMTPAPASTPRTTVERPNSTAPRPITPTTTTHIPAVPSSPDYNAGSPTTRPRTTETLITMSNCTTAGGDETPKLMAVGIVGLAGLILRLGVMRGGIPGGKALRSRWDSITTEP